jgi:hypothetical protein
MISEDLRQVPVNLFRVEIKASELLEKVSGRI